MVLLVPSTRERKEACMVLQSNTIRRMLHRLWQAMTTRTTSLLRAPASNDILWTTLQAVEADQRMILSWRSCVFEQHRALVYRYQYDAQADSIRATMRGGWV